MKTSKKFIIATLFAVCTSSLIRSADSSDSSLFKIASLCMAGYFVNKAFDSAANKALDKKCCSQPDCHKHLLVPKSVSILNSNVEGSLYAAVPTICQQKSWISSLFDLTMVGGFAAATGTLIINRFYPKKG